MPCRDLKAAGRYEQLGDFEKISFVHRLEISRAPAPRSSPGSAAKSGNCSIYDAWRGLGKRRIPLSVQAPAIATVPIKRLFRTTANVHALQRGSLTTLTNCPRCGFVADQTTITVRRLARNRPDSPSGSRF